MTRGNPRHASNGQAIPKEAIDVGLARQTRILEPAHPRYAINNNVHYVCMHHFSYATTVRITITITPSALARHTTCTPRGLGRPRDTTRAHPHEMSSGTKGRRRGCWSAPFLTVPQAVDHPSDYHYYYYSHTLPFLSSKAFETLPQAHSCALLPHTLSRSRLGRPYAFYKGLV